VDLLVLEPNVNFEASFVLSVDFLFGFGSSQQTHLSSVLLFLASQTLHFHSSAAKVGFFIPAAAQSNPVAAGLVSLDSVVVVVFVSADAAGLPNVIVVVLVSDDAIGFPKVIVEAAEAPPNVNFEVSFGLSEAVLFGFGSSQHTHLASVFLFWHHKHYISIHQQLKLVFSYQQQPNQIQLRLV